MTNPAPRAIGWLPRLARDPGRLTLVIGLVVLAIWVLGFATRGFLSGDSGMKLAQAHALLESKLTTRALPYDWQIDPKGHYFPYGELAVEIGGERQGIYSWVFTGATVPLLVVFGIDGIVILPLLGGVLAGIALLRVMRRLGCGVPATSIAIVTTLLLTPLAFYSSQYNEHALATGLILLAVSYAMPTTADGSRAWHPVIAGVLVALAATMRTEAYCAVSALGMGIVVQGPGGLRERARVAVRFLAGCVPVLAVFWAVNLWSAGIWDLAFYGNKERHPSLAGALVMLIGELDAANWTGWFVAVSIPAVLGLVPPSWQRGRIALVLHVASAALIAGVAFRANQLATGRVLVGLIAVTPIAGYGLIAGPWRGRTRLLWTFVVAYTLQVLVLDKTGTGGGLQLGARYLVPTIPILIALALATAEDDWRAAGRRLTRAFTVVPVAVLIALSAVFSIRGTAEAAEIAENGRQACQRAIELGPKVIIGRRQWETQLVTPALFQGRQLYDADGDVTALFQHLVAAGIHEVVYLAPGRISMPLGGGHLARTVDVSPGWLYVQRVVID